MISDSVGGRADGEGTLIKRNRQHVTEKHDERLK